MSFHVGLQGLVLCLDAGVSSSYPGSGTTWTDLSGKGNNGTLLNGVGFDGGNGGSLSFDGVDDHVNVNNAIMLGGKNTNVTVESAFYLPSGGNHFIGNQRESMANGHGWYAVSLEGSTPSISFSQHSSGNPPYAYAAEASSTGVSNLNIDGWNIISWSISVGLTSLSCNYMINGYTETIVNDSLIFANIYTTTQNNILINKFKNYTFGEKNYNSDVAFIRVYNRSLRQSEQLQNFNAHRGRFGI